MITVEYRGYAGFFGRVDGVLVVAYCRTWTQAAALALRWRRARKS